MKILQDLDARLRATSSLDLFVHTINCGRQRPYSDHLPMNGSTDEQIYNFKKTVHEFLSFRY
ncbi:hypothetical protein [Zhaonella formicivorans]|uniref:hypothetical protein n=1 Tax=Zhaonella formicivorans TaxID=2528593 RepID=UPI0010E3D5B5|nr:hypothetical protein [Zhaonella formicivorans]